MMTIYMMKYGGGKSIELLDKDAMPVDDGRVMPFFAKRRMPMSRRHVQDAALIISKAFRFGGGYGADVRY